jgi:hypothetical protein
MIRKIFYTSATALSLTLASCAELPLQEVRPAEPENTAITTDPGPGLSLDGESLARGIQVNRVRSGSCFRPDWWWYGWETSCNFNGGYAVIYGGGYNGNFNVQWTGGSSAWMRFYRYSATEFPGFITQVCRLEKGLNCANPWADKNVGIQVIPDVKKGTTFFQLVPR